MLYLGPNYPKKCCAFLRAVKKFQFCYTHILGDFNALLGKEVIYEQKGSKSQTEKFDCEAAVQRVL